MSGRYIDENVKRRLYAESMGYCMNPNCRCNLFAGTGDIIEKAHIDPYCKTADNSFENLVLLCPNCHTNFDKNNAFTPQEILSWKKTRQEELKNFFENNASKYDAIWVNVCSLANIDYLKMAKKYGIKRRIIHSHNSQNMDSRLRGILHKYNKKRIAYYVTDFWSCSKEASEWFYDSSIIKKSIIISNAIDVEKYCFDDVKRKKLRRDLKWEENYIIGNIGRLHFQKNQMFILDIFEKLIKKEPKVRLILIGDGEDRTKLEKEIDKKKLNKYVHMAGIQKDICGWLSTFDLFLFPSKFEGLSMAAMEAQANGVPMLASDSVIPKEVKINPSFIFWNLENSAESWAEEILNIKENINRVSQKEIVDNFTMRGYEIHTEAKKLEKLLLNGVVNK